MAGTETRSSCGFSAEVLPESCTRALQVNSWSLEPSGKALSGEDNNASSELDVEHPSELSLYKYEGHVLSPVAAVDMVSVNKFASDSALSSLYRETAVLWELLVSCFSEEVM